MTNAQAYELYHHGILGMKWGVRRTPEQLGHRTGNRGKSQAQIESENDKKRAVRERGTLSAEELSYRLQRIRMEKELRKLTEEELYPGKAAAKQALMQIGTNVARTAITGAALYAMKAAIGGDFNPSELGSAIFNGGAKKK